MNRLAICALILLASCRDDRPPAPSTQQSAQLDEAEKLLNAMAENEEGPADRSASPSNQTD